MSERLLISELRSKSLDCIPDEANLNEFLQCLRQVVEIIFPFLTVRLRSSPPVYQILPPRLQFNPLIGFIL